MKYGLFFQQDYDDIEHYYAVIPDGKLKTALKVLKILEYQWLGFVEAIPRRASKNSIESMLKGLPVYLFTTDRDKLTKDYYQKLKEKENRLSEHPEDLPYSIASMSGCFPSDPYDLVLEEFILYKLNEAKKANRIAKRNIKLIKEWNA